MSPIVAFCWFVDCLILMDFRSLLFVTIRSFQLMKRIDMSCLDRRLEARIVLMKTFTLVVTKVWPIESKLYLVNQLEILNISCFCGKKLIN